MITIDQLLESVDLDFEPRWVTKDKNGTITIFKTKPKKGYDVWVFGSREEYFILNKFKVAEFADKPWQECIYEVPRKTTGNIEKIALPVLVDEQIENPSSRDIWIHTIVDKIAELVDAVNEINENYACIAALTDIRKRLDTLEKNV